MTQPPLAETLQVHEGLVRGLARGVLGLDDRVDDVVQETWRTALEKAPRDPSRLRAWLAAVARNRALTILRRDKTRRRYERALPQRDPAGSAAEIAEREETRRRLVHALLHQPEPYRRTLLLRYYEDCSVTEIARRMDVSRETVKTRLRRALERLRAELDGSDGRRLALLVPLALGRPASALAIAGGMVVGSKAKLGLVAVLLLALLATIGYRMRDDEPAKRSTAREPGTLSASERRNPSDPAAAPRRVTGRCASAMDDAPVAGAEIRVGALAARTDTAGRFRIDLGAMTGVPRIVIEAEGFEKRSLAPAADNDVDLGTVYLRPARVLVGSVRSASGEALPGADVQITVKDHLIAQLETDSEGTFRFAATRAALNTVARARGMRVAAHKPGYRAEVAYAAGFDDPVHLVLDRGEAVAGTVRDARTGAPLEGALICNRLRSHGTSATGFVVATTDADGRFRASSCALRETQWQLLASKPEYAPQAFAVSDPSASVEFVLAPATILRGSVVRNGRPVEDVEVFAVAASDQPAPPANESELLQKVRDRRRELEEQPGFVTPVRLRRSVLMPGARTRADGTFEIAGVPADTPLRVTARRDSVTASVAIASAPVDSLVLELVPDPGQTIITVAVVDPGGRPVRDAAVSYAYAVPRKRVAHETVVGTTGRGGTVEIVGRRTWSYGIWITARTGSRSGVVGPVRYSDVADRVVQVTVAGATRLRGRLEPPASSARLRVKLWRAVAGDSHIPWDEAFVPGVGSFGLLGTPAGEYVLVITGGGVAPHTIPVSLRDDPPTLDLGTIPLQPGRRLSGTVARNGAPVPKVLVTVRCASAGPLLSESERPRMVTGEDGRFAFDSLPYAPVTLEAIPLLNPVPIERDCDADVTTVEIELGAR